MNKDNYVKSKNHVNVTPGESLRIIRELQGLSQNELAALIGSSQSNISAIEMVPVNWVVSVPSP